MLKKYQDSFIRKIIVAFLLMVGFIASDISGQQNMTAKTQRQIRREKILANSSLDNSQYRAHQRHSASL